MRYNKKSRLTKESPDDRGSVSLESNWSRWEPGLENSSKNISKKKKKGRFDKFDYMENYSYLRMWKDIILIQRKLNKKIRKINYT